MVKVSDIYKGIIKHYIWENYSDAKERLLRNKYTTLQQKLVFVTSQSLRYFSRLSRRIRYTHSTR